MSDFIANKGMESAAGYGKDSVASRLSGIVLCFNCNSPIASDGVYRCSKCGNLFCDKHTIQKDETPYCVTCYLSGLNAASRNILINVLNRKGIKIGDASGLVFRGTPVKELSQTKASSDRVEFKVGLAGKGGSIDTDRETFEWLWKKALEMGHVPERIPFGQRIVL